MASVCDLSVATGSSFSARRASPCPSPGLLPKCGYVKGLLFYTASSQVVGAECRITKIVSYSAHVFPKLRWQTEENQAPKAEFRESKKKANLCAERKQRITLPNYSDGFGKVYSFQEFITHPLGRESILNTRALQSFQLLDSNTFRCTLPKIQFLKFEISPVVVLRIVPGSEHCAVEMLSCKFEGSEAVERQNDYFSAFMKNYITWDMSGSEPSLYVDVKLNVILEVRTLPFTLLPLSAIETPGNLALQGLIDQMVPLLIQQLRDDYDKWVREQLAFSS